MKKLITVLLGLFVLAVGAYAVVDHSPKSGTALYQRTLWIGDNLTVGPEGATPVEALYTGTCNAATTALPLEATSTDSFTCSVPGVQSGDQVVVTLPNYDLVFGGLSVSGATASTDTITFGILNATGVATSSFPLATTSVQYVVYRD